MLRGRAPSLARGGLHLREGVGRDDALRGAELESGPEARGVLVLDAVEEDVDDSDMELSNNLETSSDISDVDASLAEELQ